MNVGSKLRITLEGRIKLAITSTLVVYSIIVSIIKGNYVFIPMLLSFCGDVSLMKKRDCFYNKSANDFRTGVLFFMSAHIAYAYMMETDIRSKIIDIMIISFVLLIFLKLLEVNKDILTVLLYSIVLTSSAINMYHFGMVTFFGGMLFVLSDALIGLFMIMKKDDYVSQFLIWVTYVPAQAIILTSFLLK